MLLGHNFREFNILLDKNLFSETVVQDNQNLIKQFIIELEIYQKSVNRSKLTEIINNHHKIQNIL